MLIPAGPAVGPGWTDILTAVGTVGAVAAAVGIALWTERRSGKRITAEHRRTDGLIREERECAAAVLADQREHEKSALDDERAHGRKLLEEERRLSLEREQLAQAYAVQVLLAQLPHPNVADAATGEALATRQLLAGIVNRSAYTVTRIEVRFCLGGSTMVSHREVSQLPSPSTPEALRTGPWPCPDPAMRGILTPFDGGLQFETEAIPERDLADPYALARWTDHWGTRWEHERGVVRIIRDDETWQP
jgi:hypothetical protein